MPVFELYHEMNLSQARTNFINPDKTIKIYIFIPTRNILIPSAIFDLMNTFKIFLSR